MGSNVRLVMLGDVAMVTKSSLETLSKANDLLSSLNADMVLANLEAPIGKGKPALGKINLSASENAISFIHEAGINIVNLANNHILDYGETAAKRTMSLLDQSGIRYFGVGRLSDMANPIMLDVDGLKFALMGYASPTTHPVFASSDALGCDRLDVVKIQSDIRSIRQQVDFVVVSLYWGLQDQSYPMPSQVDQAHSIIDAGADVIVGHHAHVFQGIEQYRKGIIFYGLGNFIFPDVELDSYFDENGSYRTYHGKWYSWNQRSLVPVLDFSGDSTRVHTINIAKYDSTYGNLEFLEGLEESKVIRRLSAISNPITRPEYSVFWKAQIRLTNLRLLWGRWRENGFKPSLKVRHFGSLVNHVFRGRLPELDENDNHKS